MRTSAAIAGSLILFTVGYVLGQGQILAPSSALAQAGGDKKAAKAGPAEQGALVDVSDETKTKIKAAADALKSAMEALQDEGRYKSAIRGVNAFSVLSGRGSSLEDLQRGGVVDPETFAGLYAGLAVDEVAAKLGKDADGRLTYNNKVVRMYPISLIRQIYGVRSEITGEELLPAAAEVPEKSKARKPREEPVEESTDGDS